MIFGFDGHKCVDFERELTKTWKTTRKFTEPDSQARSSGEEFGHKLAIVYLELVKHQFPDGLHDNGPKEGKMGAGTNCPKVPEVIQQSH